MTILTVIGGLYAAFYIPTRLILLGLGIALWFSEYNHHDGSLFPAYCMWSLLLLPFGGELFLVWFIATAPRGDIEERYEAANADDGLLEE